MSTRTYQDAIACLNTLQSNAAHIEAVRATGIRKNDLAIAEMIAYLEKLGYKVTIDLLCRTHVSILIPASSKVTSTS